MRRSQCLGLSRQSKQCVCVCVFQQRATAVVAHINLWLLTLNTLIFFSLLLICVPENIKIKSLPTRSQLDTQIVVMDTINVYQNYCNAKTISN